MRIFLILLILSLKSFAAISITAKGTNSITSATSLQVSATCSTFDLLIVNAVIGQPSSGPTASWNSLAMSGPITVNPVGGNPLYVFYLNVPAGATSNVTVSWGGAHSAAMTASTATGIISASPLGQTATGSGNSTAPSSGATATTVQNVELAWGAICVFGNAVSGTWQNSWSGGQTVKGSAASGLAEGFKVLSVKGAQTAAQTGDPSAAWGAICVTFKGVSLGCTLSLLGVGQC